MIRTLCQKDCIQTFSNQNPEKVVEFMKQKEKSQ